MLPDSEVRIRYAFEGFRVHNQCICIDPSNFGPAEFQQLSDCDYLAPSNVPLIGERMGDNAALIPESVRQPLPISP